MLRVIESSHLIEEERFGELFAVAEFVGERLKVLGRHHDQVLVDDVTDLVADARRLLGVPREHAHLVAKVFDKMRDFNVRVFETIHL